MNTTTNPPGGRGCGSRSEGMPYCCCGTSPNGMPIEYFLIDPALPWPGKFQRGTKILPRNPKDPNSINDLVIFVGEKYYQSAWDFVEETRRFGASRKVSPTLPFEKLTPFKSRMVFVHSNVIPQFNYELNSPLNDPTRPEHGCKFFQNWVDDKEAWLDTIRGYHPVSLNGNTVKSCTFALKDLAFLVHGDIEPDPENLQSYWVNMPSFRYYADYPTNPEVYIPTTWQIGVFLALPLTHIEYKKRPHKQADERAKKAGFETVVMEH